MSATSYCSSIASVYVEGNWVGGAERKALACLFAIALLFPFANYCCAALGARKARFRNRFVFYSRKGRQNAVKVDTARSTGNNLAQDGRESRQSNANCRIFYTQLHSQLRTHIVQSVENVNRKSVREAGDPSRSAGDQMALFLA